MGSLNDLIKFVEDTTGSVTEIHSKVSKVQETFNSNFNNVVKVRNSELEFLQEKFFSDHSLFPSKMNELYNEALPVQKKSFTKNLSDLSARKKELETELAAINKNRNELFDKLKKSNTSIDGKEEAIKIKIEDLQNQIDIYNTTIKEMNSGFGFITNFLSMKKIENKKEELLEKQGEMVDNIETVRNKWIEVEKRIEDKNLEIQEKWNYLQTELAIISEKLLNLTGNKDELIKKGAFLEAISTLKGYEDFILKNVSSPRPVKCGRCSSDNTKNLFFCAYCGEHFSDNRPDIEGSLVETGELNVIHASLMEGIKQCVSFIALMKGITDGLNVFIKSLKDVKSSEDKYPLPKLKIDVPAFSAKISEEIKTFEKSLDIKFLNLHPLELAEKTGSFVDATLTSENIEKYFTSMGDELNKTTKEQW
jgi:hypothetical protein